MNHKLDTSSIKVVVFDFDGTLARLNINFPAMRSSIRKLMKDFKIPVSEFTDLDILEMIEDPELEKCLGASYLEYRKKVPMFFPYPGQGKH